MEITRRWSLKLDDYFIGGAGLLLLIFELGIHLFTSSGTIAVLELVPIILGPIMVYYSLGHLFNSTQFSVTMSTLTVRKGPIPWHGNRVVSSADVVKLGVRGEERRSRRRTWNSFPVIAILKDGKQVVLDTFEKEDQAGFLHQELERRLRIPPQPD